MSKDMQFDAFLSYASIDEDWVKSLKNGLVSKGLKVWLACDEILPGDSFPTAIEKAMAVSGTVVLVISPESLASGWVQKEYSTAVALEQSNGIRTVPVLLRTAKLPPFIAALQWADFRDDSRFDASLNRLIKGIRGRATDVPRTVKRICFISSEYPPRVYGGLGVHVEELTRALAQSVEIDILLPDKERDAADYQQLTQGVQPIPVNVSASYNEPASWFRFAKYASGRFERLAAKQPPDIIHCHDWVTILAGIRSKQRLKIPLLFHVHLPNRSPLAGSIENLGLVCADVVTVNSEAMAVEISDRGLPIRKLRVIPNGVDVGIFYPSDSWPKDDGYVLFIGRLVEQKGVEYLLRAFLYVREQFPDVRLKIVGGGEFKEWLERLANNLMLSSHVDFLGWKSHEALPALYQEARVVVVPSVFEPFGMVALEAFACKRPVIASRIGGLKEIVRHKVNGFLAQPKDHLDLAQWLMALLNDSDQRERMAQAGFDQIEDKGYTWPAIAQQYLELYEESKRSGPDVQLPREASAFINQIVDMAAVSDRWDWSSFLRELNP